MNSSQVFVTILIVVIAVAGAIGFLQADRLLNTREALTSAQADGTQSAGILEIAEASGTEVARELGNAQASGTEVANDFAESALAATEAIGVLEDALTESADEAVVMSTQSSSELNTIVATLTQVAVEVRDYQADVDATNEANASTMLEMSANATQQSVLLTDALATNEAQTTALEEFANTIATQTAELDLAQSEPEPTETPETTAEPESETEDASADISEPSEELILFVGDGYELELPSDYLVFDLRTDADDALETFSDLGDAYDDLVAAAEQGALFGDMIAGRDTVNVDGTVDRVLMLSQELPPAVSAFTMEELITALTSSIPGDIEISDSGVREVDDKIIGFFVVEDRSQANTETQSAYVHRLEDTVYVLLYLTSAELFDDRRPIFDRSGESFFAVE